MYNDLDKIRIWEFKLCQSLYQSFNFKIPLLGCVNKNSNTSRYFFPTVFRNYQKNK
jgi:hypothetical protein